jgi:putative phage-type endonuclease
MQEDLNDDLEKSPGFLTGLVMAAWGHRDLEALKFYQTLVRKSRLKLPLLENIFKEAGLSSASNSSQVFIKDETKMIDPSNNYIVQCLNCSQKLRVPSNNVAWYKCPKCGWKSVFPSEEEPELSKPYTIIDLVQGTLAWHQWRRNGIGASEAPAIMGENPWKSRRHLLKEKISYINDYQNIAMINGSRLEPEARDCYERSLGIKVRPVCLQSTRFSWLRASIDGLAYDGSSVVEIKCGNRVYEIAAYEKRVPKYYMGQLQHILAVTGLQQIDFWCFLPDLPQVHLRVVRDDHYIDRLIEEEHKFWEEVSINRA